MTHLHKIYDSDAHFIIDPVTRAVVNAQSKKIILVEGDHDSERFTFQLPRYIEGHDMTLCNDVKVHYDNVSLAGEESKDAYPVDDCDVSPDDEDVVVFSWLISGNATKYVGTLAFAVTFMCLADDGAVEYKWGTLPNSAISIGDGINNNEAIAEGVSDVLAQWHAELMDMVTEATNTAIDDAKKSGAFKGDPGEAATVKVGTVTTLEAGSEATVENAGTESEAVFNFGIPKGKDGYTPQKGIDYSDGVAATISVGEVTTLDPGAAATVENAGTESAAVLKFGIPKGEPGHTPIKGTDYWTTDDQTKMIQDVINALNNGDEVSY